MVSTVVSLGNEVSIVFFAVTIFISPLITGFLYSTLIEGARPYLVIANAAAVISVAGSMVQPAVLKFAPIRWQIITQNIQGIIYFGGGLLALPAYGLIGFCFAALTANTVRIGILCWVGDRVVRKA